MNTKQIQIDLIKEIHKNRPAVWWFDTDTDLQYEYVCNGYVLYKIPRAFWFLNTENMTKAESNFSKRNLISLCENLFIDNEYLPGEMSNERIISDKKTLAAIKNKENTVYINTDFLKNFDKDNISFLIKNNVSPVMVCEYHEFAGLIMPIRYNPAE